MKKLLFILLIGARIVSGQEITGAWSGELAVQGIKLPLIFHITKEGEGYKTLMDSPKQGAKGLAVQETRFENGELTIVAPALGLKYTGKLRGEDTVEGTFSQGGMSVPLTLKKGMPETVQRRPQTPVPPLRILYGRRDL
ncbi:MAG: hypothetical protein LRY55_13725 [Leadbetterella sp.]|nr:hypothetical protein [Leadbetterella sp.]